ncbi:MAG: EFR1 family ferrodoxin [Lachnospiraceae bacterium]|nr:EFR1 family ferrodoxin [Lachnospiraceae bacterium]
MVLFFSATGNTEFIADNIAKDIGDESLDLLERIKRSDFSDIYSEKPFIICAPIYVCEMPRFLAAYLKKVRLLGNRLVYFVFTSGGYTGIAPVLAKRMVRKKGMIYMGRAEFKMPRNYPLSDRYRLLSDEEDMERIRASYRKIPRVEALIKKEKYLKGRHVFLFELMITLPYNPLWVRYNQPSKPFYATDKCIGCHKCEKVCPLNNIYFDDKYPKWKSSCAHCMACYSSCPKEAIEYGDKTLGKKRYRLDKYADKEGKALH